MSFPLQVRNQIWLWFRYVYINNVILNIFYLRYIILWGVIHQIKNHFDFKQTRQSLFKTWTPPQSRALSCLESSLEMFTMGFLIVLQEALMLSICSFILKAEVGLCKIIAQNRVSLSVDKASWIIWRFSASVLLSKVGNIYI